MFYNNFEKLKDAVADKNTVKRIGEVVAATEGKLAQSVEKTTTL